jgi:hypothetical protein
MVRVQILLTEEENALLRSEARRERISLSEVVRRRLRVIPANSEPANDPFFKMIGSMTGEVVTDLSTHHDTYVYGGELDQ